MGFSSTNCSAICFVERTKRPLTGSGGRQQVPAAQEGSSTKPCIFTSTAPGPPTYARHSAMKL